MAGVSLKYSEIYINSKSGINCTFNSSLFEVWQLGKLVLKNLVKVCPFLDDKNWKRIIKFS